MSRRNRTLVFTQIPSPYQVELFNAVDEYEQGAIVVCYAQSKDPARQWRLPEIRHEHLFLDDDVQKYEHAERLVRLADLTVVSHYRDRKMIRLLKAIASGRNPWCFWGERPGYKFSGPLGTLYRRWRLAVLHSSRAPIWGMGSWAVEGYAGEFGNRRLYVNLPYFSDLDRFKPGAQAIAGSEKWPLEYLFSGTLIKRKGVDLLTEAFARLAFEFQNVELTVVGDGKLRVWMQNKLASYRDRVRFVGFQQWEALPRFYSSANVLCAPARYDGWNLAVPEGLAAGLPVISTDQTGAALELLQHRKNGWVVPAGDVEALYQAMREARELSAKELQRRSEAARRAAEEHSLSEGVRRFQEAVEQTLHAGG